MIADVQTAPEKGWAGNAPRICLTAFVINEEKQRRSNPEFT